PGSDAAPPSAHDGAARAGAATREPRAGLRRPGRGVPGMTVLDTLVTLLTEPWQYGFMQRAFAITVVAAVVCAVLSCWLVLIGWSLLGDAVSHAVLPGVVLSYLLGAPFAVGAFVFGIGAVALIGLVRDTSRLKEDTAIGVVFTTLFALGVVLVSVTPSDVDLTHIPSGAVVGQVPGLAVFPLGLVLPTRRATALVGFGRGDAHAIGISPRRLSALLLGLLALTVVVAWQAVGVVLVLAMGIPPGATVY